MPKWFKVSQNNLTPTISHQYWSILSHILQSIHFPFRLSSLLHRICREPENFTKNRYADVLPIDSSRVKLKRESPHESDYINANFVNGFDHDKAYICTQGPLEHTVKDQWRLIMQEQVRVIVMTTR